jgi:hypothetical protein
LFSTQIKLIWLVYKEKINKFLNSFKKKQIWKRYKI